MRIFKHELQLEQRQLLQVPAGTQFLHVGEQNELPFVWALSDPSKKLEPRVLRTATTGEVFSKDAQLAYIGTCHIKWFVAHVFELLGGSDPLEERFQGDYAQIRRELDAS